MVTVYNLLTQKYKECHSIIENFIPQMDLGNWNIPALLSFPDFGIPMKLVRLIKMTLTNTKSKVKIQEKLSPSFETVVGL
jgi:hypothetical protein